MRRAIVTVIAPTLIALGALAGACEPDPADIVDEVDNLAPIARVVGAQVARVGEPARFDASASDDEDGVVIAFSASFGDGAGLVSGDDDGVFEHVFAAPGRFTIRIEAEDDVGAVTAVTLETVVVEGGLEACACDAPCLDAGVCTVDAACVVVATSADEVAPVVDDALTCD
jgi:hypothetical protein